MPSAESPIRWARVDSGPPATTSPALTASRPCPICESTGPSRPFLEFPDFQFFSDDTEKPKRARIRDVQCRTCFAAYLDPVYTPRGFSVLFAEAGRSYGATPGRAAEQVEWLADRGIVQAGRSVLDIGCYEGAFLATLPEGVLPMGVDIDEAAIERARERLGESAQLVTADFEQFELPAQPDVITMFHVLEHLPRPVNVLTRLRGIAHADTELVVEVPVMEGRPTNDLVNFFTVQHTTHFSQQSLSQCLARAGWTIIERSSQPTYNGHRVRCTPCEPVAQATGDPHDVPRAVRVLIQRYEAVIDVSSRVLAGLDGVERCLIWGGGMHLEHLYADTPMFAEDPTREYLILDGDPIKQGTRWRGIDVLAPDALSRPECRGIPLLVSSYGSQPEIVQAARSSGVPEELIVTLYDEVSVY